MGSAISIIILAAGTSSRLGRPKQLLEWGSSTLLNHVIGQANGSIASDVLIILDRNHREILGNIETGKANILWIEGERPRMSRTIFEGMNHVQNSDAAILATCDQPFVTSQLFDSMVERFNQGHELVASEYDSNSYGIPSLFSSKWYSQLRNLQGDSGAKRLLQQAKKLELVKFPLGDFDADTEKDYQACLQELATH